MTNNEKTLHKWLPDKKTRVVIYDYDNTLFHSLLPEEGKELYWKRTGKTWPFTGWWGRVETLLPPLVTEPITEAYFVAETLAAFRTDRQRKDTNCYLMTGRPGKVAGRIKEILQAVNVNFDRHYFRGGPAHLSDTLEIKLYLIANEIITPEIEILEIWEDRAEHIEVFTDKIEEWKEQFPNLREIIIHAVENKNEEDSIS